MDDKSVDRHNHQPSAPTPTAPSALSVKRTSKTITCYDNAICNKGISRVKRKRNLPCGRTISNPTYITEGYHIENLVDTECHPTFDDFSLCLLAVEGHSKSFDYSCIRDHLPRGRPGCRTGVWIPAPRLRGDRLRGNDRQPQYVLLDKQSKGPGAGAFESKGKRS